MKIDKSSATKILTKYGMNDTKVNEWLKTFNQIIDLREEERVSIPLYTGAYYALSLYIAEPDLRSDAAVEIVSEIEYQMV